MSARAHAQNAVVNVKESQKVGSGVLQRKCARSKSSDRAKECRECRSKPTPIAPDVGTRGHPALSWQLEFAEEHKECDICSPYLPNHPPEQHYYIVNDLE